MDGLTESELQLITCYLRPRIISGTLANAEWISEVNDICSFDPDELVVISKEQRTEGEWWFISTGTKPPYMWQIAKNGNWEEHLESVKVTMENGETAWKISVVFCKHGSPRSIETEWRMDQFHLPKLTPLIFLCRLWKSEEFTAGINGSTNGTRLDPSKAELSTNCNGGINGSQLDEGAASSSSATSSTVETNKAQNKKEEIHQEYRLLLHFEGYGDEF
ncbi:NAC domain-containing protein 1-like isoform X2 [Aristolochia californica]|uniref:NAC domain-containing protein 1-like isoform X2 n=1 Tax=Aristolochia californica TaxID=171875 RepID=UPI0035E0B414